QAGIKGILRRLIGLEAFNGIGHLGRIQRHSIRTVIEWVWPESRISAVIPVRIKAWRRIDDGLPWRLLGAVTWIIQYSEELKTILYGSLCGFEQGNFFSCAKAHIGTGLKADTVSVAVEGSGTVAT